ncbi:MAG: hypothetical protein ACPLIG_07495 [Candidatus Bathyarchaeales archaeon]
MARAVIRYAVDSAHAIPITKAAIDNLLNVPLLKGPFGVIVNHAQ